MLAGKTSFTSGFASVSVPVLSNTTIFTLDSRSIALMFFIRMNRLEDVLDDIRSVIGVARPIAHGHAMTMTETKASTVILATRPLPAELSNTYQIEAATIAAIITIGTK